MTGNTIYYQHEGGERRSLRTEAKATTANISGLISGATYFLSILALSTFLPSSESVEYFTLGMYTRFVLPHNDLHQNISANCSPSLIQLKL